MARARVHRRGRRFREARNTVAEGGQSLSTYLFDCVAEVGIRQNDEFRRIEESFAPLRRHEFRRFHWDVATELVQPRAEVRGVLVTRGAEH
jgi:hypothetical protein